MKHEPIFDNIKEETKENVLNKIRGYGEVNHSEFLQFMSKLNLTPIIHYDYEIFEEKIKINYVINPFGNVSGIILSNLKFLTLNESGRMVPQKHYFILKLYTIRKHLFIK